MDMPKNIKASDFKTTEANIPKLTHHEDFVMRMFFMRYPKQTGWDMCLYLLRNAEDASFTRWMAYNNIHEEDLIGEMESMLADLRQEFSSNLTKPSPLPTPSCSAQQPQH